MSKLRDEAERYIRYCEEWGNRDDDPIHAKRVLILLDALEEIIDPKEIPWYVHGWECEVVAREAIKQAEEV